jgi:hypothetical protein
VWLSRLHSLHPTCLIAILDPTGVGILLLLFAGQWSWGVFGAADDGIDPTSVLPFHDRSRRFRTRTTFGECLFAFSVSPLICCASDSRQHAWHAASKCTVGVFLANPSHGKHCWDDVRCRSLALNLVPASGAVHLFVIREHSFTSCQ